MSEIWKNCRCCGKEVYYFLIDNSPIHTKCIGKHWSKHCKGINNTRCKEFKNYKNLIYK